MRLLGRRELIGTTVSASAVALVASACSGDDQQVTAESTPVTGPNDVDTLPGEVEESTVAPQTLAPPIDSLPEPGETTPPTTAGSVTTTPPTTLPVPEPAPEGTDPVEPYGRLGTISIPALRVKAALGIGVSMANLDEGPGYWPGTAKPGAKGNCVIAGHRTSHSRPFRHMDKLKQGDDVVMTTKDGTFVYKVKDVIIVPPTAMEIIDQTPEYTATLFACHPPGSVAERIVTRCVLDKKT